MRKATRIGIISLVLLLYFHLSTYAATETTPWKLHHISVIEVTHSNQLFHHQESLQMTDELNLLTKEMEGLLEKEKIRIISKLQDYQNQHEKQLHTINDDLLVVEKMERYEHERVGQMKAEMNQEVVDFLKEITN